MTKPNGRSNGEDPGKIASLDDARRRAAAKAKSEKRAAYGASGTRSLRDWLIGGLVLVMALGYIASFFVGSPQVSTGGVQ